MGNNSSAEVVGAEESVVDGNQVEFEIGNDVMGENPPPKGSLLFHHVHGDNVKLFKGGKQAKRVGSFCKGLAFSQRPIRLDEVVCIKFAEIASNWSGVLRFGVTNNDPTTLAGSLPKYACPDLTNKPGNWAKAMPERYCHLGAILHFYVRPNGEMFYGVNGSQKGLFLSGIATNLPLWVVVDIYGNTNLLEFVDPTEVPSLRAQKQMITASQRSRSADMSASLTGPSSSTSEATLARAPLHANNNVVATSSNVAGGQQQLATLQREFQQLRAGPPPPPPRPTVPPQQSTSAVSQYHPGVTLSRLEFHSVCGRNVVLSADKMVAIRSETEYTCGYVFTGRPIRLLEVLMVQVLQVQPAYIGGLAFGLTTCDPIHLRPESLPEDSDLLLDRHEYWLVSKDVAAGPQVGDELAFCIGAEGQVWYSRNGAEPRVLMHVDHLQTFWIFFDVYGSTQKIRLLGCHLVSDPEVALRAVSRRAASFPQFSSTLLTPSSAAGSNPPTPLHQSSLNPSAIVSTGLLRPNSSGSLPIETRPGRLPPPPPPAPTGRPPLRQSVLNSVPTAFVQSNPFLNADGTTNFGSNLASTIGVATRSAHKGPPPTAPKSQPQPQAGQTAPMAAAAAGSSGSNSGGVEEADCIICMALPPDSVLYPCGHLCLCFDCSKSLTMAGRHGSCPICRAEIVDVIRVFRP